MKAEAIGRALGIDAPRFALVLCLGLLAASGAHAQEGASAPAGEAAAPGVDGAAARSDLATRLADGRSELDARRERIAREGERLAAVDRPAGEAELALWHDRAAAVGLLERDNATLRTLAGLLTAEALEAASSGKSRIGQVLVPAPGLWRTAIDANLRNAPDASPFAVLEAGMIVVQLATDGEGWSLVAAPSGIGFVPASQLRREP